MHYCINDENICITFHENCNSKEFFLFSLKKAELEISKIVNRMTINPIQNSVFFKLLFLDLLDFYLFISVANLSVNERKLSTYVLYNNHYSTSTPTLNADYLLTLW